MAQTNLKTDDFCGYNQSASPFFWVMEPGQYKNKYMIGETGVYPAGGTAGSYMPGDLVDRDSFLNGQTAILTKCLPPAPESWKNEIENRNKRIDEEIRMESIRKTTNNSAKKLIPLEGTLKRAAGDLSSVDYYRWNPNLFVEPQDLNHIIETFAAQRGGLDTREAVKLSWNPQNNDQAHVKGSGILASIPKIISPGALAKDAPVTLENARKACASFISPTYACGKKCEGITGYPGQPWNTDPNAPSKTIKAEPRWGKMTFDQGPGLPKGSFEGPTSKFIQENVKFIPGGGYQSLNPTRMQSVNHVNP